MSMSQSNEEKLATGHRAARLTGQAIGTLKPIFPKCHHVVVYWRAALRSQNSSVLFD